MLIYLTKSLFVEKGQDKESAGYIGEEQISAFKEYEDAKAKARKIAKLLMKAGIAEDPVMTAKDECTLTAPNGKWVIQVFARILY